MAALRFRSVRARLIATTMVVFGVLLIGLGVVSDVGSRSAVLNSIDKDLRRRGEDFARVVVPHDDGRGPHRGHGDRPGEGPRPGGRSPGDGHVGNVHGAESSRGDRPGGDPFRDHPHPPDGPPPTRPPDPEWIAPNAIWVQNNAVPGYDPVKLAYDPVGFAEAARGETVLRTVVVDGEPRRVYSGPAFSKGKITHVVQLAYAMRPALDAMDNFRANLIKIVIPLGLVFGGLASFFVVDRLLSPLRRITAEAGRIGSEGFGERLVPLGDDEFASLVGTLNGMLGRLEKVYRTEQETSRRLTAAIEQQRRFTSDASHELKTPLAVIKAYVGVLKQSRARVSDEAASIVAIDQAANRMNGLIRDLLTLARGDVGNTGSRQPSKLAEIVGQALRFVPEAAERVRLCSDEPAPMVSASPDELARVFINLVDNAIKHSAKPDSVTVTVRAEGDEAVAVVADEGVGIAPEHLPHLFERFYRTDESRSADTGGSGLGLAICEQIVKAHGGRIEVESVLGQGTRVIVRLPLLPAPSAPEATAA